LAGEPLVMAEDAIEVAFWRYGDAKRDDGAAIPVHENHEPCIALVIVIDYHRRSLIKLADEAPEAGRIVDNGY